MRAAGWIPSLRLQAYYNTGYYETNRNADEQVIAFNEQIRNNQREAISASISIPIFSKNSIRSALRQSKLYSQMAENRLNQAKQDLYYEIEQNQNELNASFKELHQAQRQVEADKLSFEAAQKKFDQGMISVVEFYVIKNQYSSSTGQVLHSKLLLEVKKRMLDFYKGERFWEQSPTLK
jgi:outer membrane protein